MNRRDFMKHSAVLSTAAGIAPNTLGRTFGANDHITLGVVGSGAVDGKRTDSGLSSGEWERHPEKKSMEMTKTVRSPCRGVIRNLPESVYIDMVNHAYKF